jgi:hypothetical protein
MTSTVAASDRPRLAQTTVVDIPQHTTTHTEAASDQAMTGNKDCCLKGKKLVKTLVSGEKSSLIFYPF